MSNPLLKIDVLPAFSMVKPEHINPAITELMEKCKETIDRVVSENLEDQTWDSLVAPLEEVLDRLSISWGIVSHLNSVMSNDDLRKEHDLLLPKISDFYTWIGQHEGLYNAYKNLSESDGFSLLSLAQQKSVEEELKGFKLSGIGLSDDKKKEFAEISCRESELSSLFSNNVLDATNAFVKQVIDVNELDGLPETALALAKQEAESRGLEGYVFTLKLPSYLPVLKYANNSKLRYEMYYAYVTRASEIGPDANKFDNAKIIDEELALSLKAGPDIEIYIDDAASAELTRIKSPWLTDDCEWTDYLIRKAVFWLCKKLNKPILKLTERDYNDNGMSDLITRKGPASDLNIKIFNELQHTISGWPGGKPDADDTTRPERALPYPKRVVVFSPHPDDDVISMGGTVARLSSQGHIVNLAYETSGNIAVFDHDVIRFLDFLKEAAKIYGGDPKGVDAIYSKVVKELNEKHPGDPDPKDVLEIKAAIRRGEATSACRYLGIPDERVHFLNLPFYETGGIKKKPLGKKDIIIVKD